MSDIEASFEEPGNPEATHESPPSPSELPGYLWHPIERAAPPPLELVSPPPAPRPKLIPNIGHVVVFTVLAFASFIGGFIVVFIALWITHRGASLPMLAQQAGHNIVFAIGGQAVGYLLLWGLAALIFSLWWQRPFTQGIHWNPAIALRWLILYVGLGVVSGLAITIAGNFLPMPKDPAILKDLTTSRSGAWALLAFGVTLAPLTEELAFRGFLLPSLVNVFRWFDSSEDVMRYIGIPVAIVLTSIPFALMHSAQVSNSWGPVLLIGCVSVILCIVRLRTDSVAAGVVVHACYNLTLFSGLLYQTDWFRHLDKLKG